MRSNSNVKNMDREAWQESTVRAFHSDLPLKRCKDVYDYEL